jgi:hypothetical protein
MPGVHGCRYGGKVLEHERELEGAVLFVVEPEFKVRNDRNEHEARDNPGWYNRVKSHSIHATKPEIEAARKITERKHIAERAEHAKLVEQYKHQQVKSIKPPSHTRSGGRGGMER